MTVSKVVCGFRHGIDKSMTDAPPEFMYICDGRGHEANDSEGYVVGCDDVGTFVFFG